MSNFCYFSRNVHGVLLLDKPMGSSSNNTLQNVKHIYNARHAGYVGVLDPLASGMLPICFGEATKFIQYFLESDKKYHVIAKLGQRTDTFDSDGIILEERPVHFSITKLNVILKSLYGNTMQIPPMYSALKYQGKRLYHYARQGIYLLRQARQITIYNIVFLNYENNELELIIHCSKGTYIRAIINDIGEKLGCGAHVIYLRRLSVSTYQSEQMVTLDKLNVLANTAKKYNVLITQELDTLLMPIDSLVSNYPVVNIPLTSSFYFKQGSAVRTVNSFIKTGLVKVTEGDDNKFIGIGEILNHNHITPRRLIVE